MDFIKFCLCIDIYEPCCDLYTLFSRTFLDQLAKLTFRSRYAHAPLGSAPVPILQITIFVMRSRKVCQLSGVLIGRAKIFVILVSY